MRTELTSWSPFQEVLGLPDDMNGLVRVFFRGLDGGRTGLPEGGAWAPAVDVEERDGEYVVTADMPGLTQKDISVTVEDSALTISGERKVERMEKSGGAHRYERVAGRFLRSFTLPAGVDGNRVKAAYKDGVLTLSLPKQEEAQPKQITVKVE